MGCGVCVRDGYVPRDQGTSVAPSGLLPSLLDNPIGSLLAAMCAFLIARQIRSLSWEWRMWRGALLRHARLCRPLESTIVPQTHMRGWNTIVLRRKPVSTRMASSDNRRHTAVRGGACSQSPACGVFKAFNRAWSTGSAHLAPSSSSYYYYYYCYYYYFHVTTISYMFI